MSEKCEIISSLWAAYSDNVVPPEAETAVRINEMLTFYIGAYAMFKHMSEILANRGINDVIAELYDIQMEAQEFFAHVQAARAEHVDEDYDDDETYAHDNT